MRTNNEKKYRGVRKWEMGEARDEWSQKINKQVKTKSNREKVGPLESCNFKLFNLNIPS